MPTSIAIAARTGKEHVASLRTHLAAAAALLPLAPSDLAVILIGDKIMSNLHVRFMKIAGPTDVMTFPIDFDASGRATAGEVYVCVPEARRQATRRGNREQDEVLLYALHGLLHLCGFDDTTAREFNRMHRKEDEILTRLGVGLVYSKAADYHPPAHRRRSAR